MRPDDDPQLRSAFEELRRRSRAEAPPFENMRDRALRAASSATSGGASLVGSRSFPLLRMAGWAAAACAVVATVWIVSSDLRPRGHRPQAPAASPPLDQLITRIEEHVDFHSAVALPEYPSDVLLAPLSDSDPAL